MLPSDLQAIYKAHLPLKQSETAIPKSNRKKPIEPIEEDAKHII